MIHVQHTKDKKSLCFCRGFFILFFFTTILTFSCTSFSQNSISEFPLSNEWQKIKNLDNSEYLYFEDKSIKLCYHCVKIDLSDSDLKISTFPESSNDFIYGNSVKTDYIKGLTAKDFIKKSNAKIVINTSPFIRIPKLPKLLSAFSSKRKICGLHVVNKTELSGPVKKYSAICFKKTEKGYTGKIYKEQTEIPQNYYDFSFGGFFQILSDSKKTEKFLSSKDSRLALGLTDDGKTLFILAVEGGKSFKNTGLSFEECADILLNLGASDALQMDGGDSVSLFINGKNALSYSKIRKNAVFLGFY